MTKILMTKPVHDVLKEQHPMTTTVELHTTAGVIRLEVREMVWFLGQAPLALLKGPAESQGKH